MEYATAEYVEINLIGIAILCIMLVYERKTHRIFPQNGQKYFDIMVVANIALLVLDTAIELMQGHASPVLTVLDHAACICYFTLHGCFGLLWLMYCLTKLRPGLKLGRWHIPLVTPMLLCLFLSLGSVPTGWIYSLDADNTYHRGPLMLVLTCLSLSYMVTGMVLILYEMIHPHRTREKNIYSVMLVFPVPTAVGIIIQMLVYGVSLIWVCTALSLMILFIYLQNEQLSHDILTGLFSRRQTDIQLNWEIAHLEQSADLFFAIVVDVDHFKRINDHLGHVQGDQALIQVARILEKVCREKDFIGRLGGDEFLICGHAETAQEVDGLVENMMKQVDLHNRARITPYKISLSAGQVVFDRNDLLSIDKIITEADIRMYAEKAMKRA